jgi:N4-gp56 family major capsid protein
MALPTSASVISSGLAAYPTIYYDRVALDTLYSSLFFYSACDLKVLPDRSGVAMQVFGYTAMVANTVPATEGTPSSVGQTLTQVPSTLSLSNYVDFISYSNKVKLTSISDTVSEGSALLSYRGALSVDTVTATVFDTASAATTLNRIDVTTGTYLTASIARKAVWQLRNYNVKPNAYDILNDATAAGWTDLQKFSDATAPSNPALVGIKGARLGNVGGCDFYESNSLPFDTNYQSSGTNGYHVYVIGHQASIASSLGKTNLDQKNFTVVQRSFEMGQNSLDVGGLIAGASVYNFWYGCIMAPQTVTGTDKFRRIRVESSIG